MAPPYVVEPGDVLLVQPASLDSPARLPGDQPILPDGTINLGRYGRLIVAGKTVDQIEPEVKSQVEAITKDAGPITVRIVSRQSKVFYVLGEVNAPGAYPLSGRETVLDALMAGGGVNTRASLRGITLSRPTPPEGCRIVLPICYNEIVQLGDTSTNYQIANGDRIFVPAKGVWDNLCRRKKGDCLPCGRPQVACTSLHGPGTDCSAFWAACARRPARTMRRLRRRRHRRFASGASRRSAPSPSRSSRLSNSHLSEGTGHDWRTPHG